MYIEKIPTKIYIDYSKTIELKNSMSLDDFNKLLNDAIIVTLDRKAYDLLYNILENK